MLNVVTKTQGEFVLKVAPQLGGAIAGLTYRDIDILRPLPNQDDVTVNQSGCFPLVPYSNRIGLGKFEFGGERYELLKNFGDHPHSIHGNAWKGEWVVAEESVTGCVLKFLHQANADECHHWPWPYQATQTFELLENELRVTLKYFNLAERTVPVGLGFHPYFANADRSLIQLNADKVLLNNENTLPWATVDVPKEWDFSTLRRPQPDSVDNCFSGWDGHANVIWAEQGIRAEMSSPDASNVIVFVSGAEKNFVAIEPVTNVNNAINDLTSGKSDQAMKLVDAGQSVSMAMIIKVSDYE
ncbi:aldose 1-epimerase [Vibrio parahaemolyticus]|nr:aldose 1-epimerase [Vibrio parahaemolyticus]EGQ9522495.1 aldose 1-epimerase [Vibrio parahaemolyticus]EHH1232508.1 aldose 1-epimerase [Vibrio parahaemolyticus]EHV5558231.1 aldose 1-epimerase [Vibrio parahaemolyticus]